jgi:RHS repeat-associated protein
MCPHKWNSRFKVLNQETSGGALAESYVIENPNAEVATLLGMVSGSNPSTGTYAYFAHDHLGSVRAVYDADKALTGDYDYTPYGSIYAQTGATALTDLPAAFTGKPLDPASGLYSFPYRIYSPELARWLSRDPLGMVDGPNVYGYVGERPIVALDPDGHIIWLLGAVFVVAAAVFGLPGCSGGSPSPTPSPGTGPSASDYTAAWMTSIANGLPPGPNVIVTLSNLVDGEAIRAELLVYVNHQIWLRQQAGDWDAVDNLMEWRRILRIER